MSPEVVGIALSVSVPTLLAALYQLTHLPPRALYQRKASRSQAAQRLLTEPNTILRSSVTDEEHLDVH